MSFNQAQDMIAIVAQQNKQNEELNSITSTFKTHLFIWLWSQEFFVE